MQRKKKKAPPPKHKQTKNTLLRDYAASMNLWLPSLGGGEDLRPATDHHMSSPSLDSSSVRAYPGVDSEKPDHWLTCSPG